MSDFVDQGLRTKLTKLIYDGDALLASQILQVIQPMRLITSRLLIQRGLFSDEPSASFSGLVAIVVELAPGRQPFYAIDVGEVLLAEWHDGTIVSCFQDQRGALQLYAGLVRALAIAHLDCGNFQRCIQCCDIAETFNGSFFDADYLAGFPLLKANALFRMLRLQEAKQTFAPFDDPAFHSIPEHGRVEWFNRRYSADFAQVEPIFDRAYAIAQTILQSLPEQRRSLEAWKKAFLSEPLDPEDRENILNEMATLETMLTDLEAIANRNDLLAPANYEALSRTSLKFQKLANRLISGDATYPNLTTSRVDHLINVGATLESYQTVDFDEIDELLAALNDAEAWCRKVGDNHTVSYVLRVIQKLQLKRGSGEEARETAYRLFSELQALTHHCQDNDQKPLIIATFKGLLSEICDLALGDTNKDLFLVATELHRGLSLAPNNLALNTESILQLRETLLPNVHYVSFSCHLETEGVYVCLSLANGDIEMRKTSLTPSGLRDLTRFFPPDRWRQQGMSGLLNLDPRGELEPLLAPVVEAIERGAIRQGDHLCIAADDPVHMVPFGYLLVAGNCRLAEYVSIGHVVSLHDASVISCRIHERVVDAKALFIPARDERNVEEKVREFCKILPVSDYTHLALDIDTCTNLGQEKVIDTLASRTLTHIHAHGDFPSIDSNKNPMDHAGILVCEDNRRPVRGNWQAKLTPKKVLEMEGRLKPQSHVSLSACVSGLGRKGMLGDTLGLTFALRKKGAVSVVASQWDVHWKVAALFFQHFYRYWLCENNAKGVAIQKAQIDTMKDIDLSQESLVPEEALAFTLYGDWR